jgi:hypothetical protein
MEKKRRNGEVKRGKNKLAKERENVQKNEDRKIFMPLNMKRF